MSIQKKILSMTIGPVAGTVIYLFYADDGTQFHDGGNRRRTEGNGCGNAGSI